MKKIIIGIVVLIVVVALILLFGSNKKAVAPISDQATTTAQTDNTNIPPRNDAIEPQ